MNNTPRIINDWKPETLSLLNTLTAAGFVLLCGNNGEETFKFDGNLDTFIENLIACDEAALGVRSPEGKRLNLYLVLGNEPGVIVSDYTCDDGLDKVTDIHYETWSGRKQPTTTATY
jgi:hypothetical protein